MRFSSFVTLWLYHVAIALALTIPIAAFSPRASWKRWELLAFLLPFSVWACATAFHDRVNALQALSTLTLAIPVAALVRARLGAHSEVHCLVAVVLLTALCLLSFGLYALLPSRPF